MTLKTRAFSADPNLIRPTARVILRVVEEDVVACEDSVDLAVAEMWERTASRRQRVRAQSFNLGVESESAKVMDGNEAREACAEGGIGGSEEAEEKGPTATIFITHGSGSDTGWLFQKICILGHGRSDSERA
ncbi:hypothetical protein Ahy_B01g055588 [Arachis hypogaea]|uniref:Uncharacterized protein n=1 Tax=Arachis hypogaea TaxID=3818 RepID=A0A445AWK9_ARAHY|nr:hypothetical protein Ahy_B01g055588 [Arachis hypogaea]